MKKTTVLVTGAGGVLGQGIIQCLRALSDRPRIVATDLSEHAAGLFLADHAFLLPHCADSHTYLNRMRELCLAFDVGAVFPGSDLEARLLVSDESWRSGLSVVLGASDRRVWETTGDKLKTYEMAQALNVLSPASLGYSYKGATDLAASHGLPIVVKPRHGSGGRGTVLVHSLSDLPLLDSYDTHLVQPYLDPVHGEYTVGTYFSKDAPGSAPAVMVALKRSLQDGYTKTAHTASTDSFERPIARIAASLGLTGYCNFQFIITEQGPSLIEINSRFSSSVSIGLSIGCNFVGIFLNDVIRNYAPLWFRSAPGTSVVRFVSDKVFETPDLKEVVDLRRAQPERA